MTTSTLLWNTSFKLVLSLALPVLAAHLIEAIIPFFNITIASSLGKNGGSWIGEYRKNKAYFSKIF